MAEIYTKPFDSVQDAIILFEERIDKNKNNTNNTNNTSSEYSKDFTNFRLQLQAKEWEKELAFSEFAASHENPDEMVNWIKLYKAETNKYMEKFRKVQELFYFWQICCPEIGSPEENGSSGARWKQRKRKQQSSLEAAAGARER
ncbi:hypothetical protein KSP39_PZI009692 [Platanthera zijinensis]|uniref:Uncharacterized protein n=1 Tax=Platanthera zijinensis TaxID=2320716 RepID=A0AAP0BHG2_9ASPA